MSNSKSRYQGKPRGPRWGLIATLAIVHVAGLYGLSRLLAPQFTASVEREVVEAFTVIITAPDTEPEPDEGMQGSPGEEAVDRSVEVRHEACSTLCILLGEAEEIYRQLIQRPVRIEGSRLEDSTASLPYSQSTG